MESPNNRTYIIDAKVVERLRQQLGLTMESLAVAAQVSVRSLRRWVRGKPAYLENVAALAKALGLEDNSTLLNGEDRLSKPPSEIKPTIQQDRVEAHITKDFDLQNYVELIKSQAQTTDEISVLSILKNGSGVVLELSRDDALMLLNAAVNGDLLKNHIKAVVIPQLNTPEIWMGLTPSD